MSEPVPVESIDRQILALLATDGRMSYTDLGRATGLSTSAVHQRVKRLERRGLILGYGATVNHAEIGLPLTAFISIRPIDPSQPDDCPERLEGSRRSSPAGRWPERSPTC
ncbi:Lrp/AsnC family transcriptional regulator [Nocardioides sambongensis]|nr:Lrp/AsnC family transcriptional regulator [Nocardioides sambongensis]